MAWSLIGQLLTCRCTLAKATLAGAFLVVSTAAFLHWGPLRLAPVVTGG
jgi:hypothetical protein